MPRYPDIRPASSRLARPAPADAPDTTAAEWFSRRDAGLTTEEEQAFQRWLTADPRNAAALAQLDSTWSTFGKPVQAGVTARLLAELSIRESRRHRRRRRIATAAVAMIAVLAVGTLWQLPREADFSQASTPTAAMHVPADQVLPDGSRVILKDGARIAVAFTDAIRRVELLHGEAHFEVAKNPARPFVVAVGSIEVHAVGTAFSVQLGVAAVEVLVTEGTVAVDDRRPKIAPGETGSTAAHTALEAAPRATEPSAVEQPSQRLIADAGKRIVVDLAPNAAALAKVTPIDAAELDGRLAWRNPRIEFSGTPLAEAVACLNRETTDRIGPRLVIADRALASMRVSGIFRTDNTDAFVLLLEAGFGVQAERSDQTITLRRAPVSPRAK